MRGPKDVELKCPCCGVEILLDVATGKIIRHGGQKKPSETLDDVLTKEKARSKDPDKKIDAAFEKLKQRKEELDQAFDEAKKKAAEEKDEPKPDPFRWD